MASKELTVETAAGPAATTAAHEFGGKAKCDEVEKQQQEVVEETEEEEEEEEGIFDKEQDDLVRSLNNFDVVLVPVDGNLELPSEGEYARHVGNQRFRITLDMNRGGFAQLLARGEETSGIVQNLVSLVREHCVPSGRFLQPAAVPKFGGGGDWHHGGGWTLVSQRRVEEFIARSLSFEQQPRIIERHDDNNNGIGVDNRHAAAAAAGPRRSAFGFRRQNDTRQTPKDTANATATSPVAESEGEKKRRRRPSLLRRSVTESNHPNLATTLEDKKKLNRTTEERRPSFFRMFRKLSTVQRTEPLDIVFDLDEFETYRLTDLPSTVGNNRLRVLMQMQQEKYKKATVDEQAAMVQEWITTVTKHWKSRFLRKLDDGTWEVMDTSAMESALDQLMQVRASADNLWSEDISSLSFEPDADSGFVQ